MPKKKHFEQNSKPFGSEVDVSRPTKSEIKKDVSEMTRQELAKECYKLNSKLNKRIKRLEQATKKDGILSPALKSIQDSGGKFSAKGKNLNELRKEYARAKAFEKMETGTVTGARAFTKRMGNVLGTDNIKNPKYIERIYETLHRVQEQLPIIGNSIGSTEALQQIVSEYNEQYSTANALIEMTDSEYARFLNDAVNNMTKTIDDSYQNLEDLFLDAFEIK